MVDFIHGGDVYTEGVLKGKELLDFSSNINPLGVPESFSSNIHEALKNILRYPDIKYRETIKNLSEYTGFSEEKFILGNGASEIISQAIEFFRDKKVLIVVPSFLEYEINAEKYCCEIEFSYLNADMKIDYKDILEKVKNSEVLIIANPNNPDGGVINKVKFKTILEFCEENNKKIIIDEAFIEFTGNNEDSYLKEIKNYKSIFIIRALTKFFAMPGIRFGFGICSDKEFLNKLKIMQNPWNINSFAETAVKYVLKDTIYINESIKIIEKEREFFCQSLNKLNIVDKVYKTKANFILVKLKSIDGIKLYDLCLDKDVLIRIADNFRGLDKSFVRFAVKSREDNLKLLGILKSI